MLRLTVSKKNTFAAHTGSVYALFRDSREKAVFYSAGGDGMVIAWNLREVATAILRARVNASIFSILMLERKQQFVIGQMQGGMHIVDLKEKKEMRHIAFHKGGLFDLKLTEDGRHFISAGGDGSVALWDTESFALVKSAAISEKSIRSMAFHPREKIMALGCSDNKAYIISSGSLEVLKTLEGFGNSVFSVCFSPDGNYLLTGSRDAHLRVWDARGFQLLHTIPAHLFTINSIVFSPDGSFFATASRDKTVKIWNAENFELLKVIDREKSDGHVNSVNKLIWLEEGNLLVSCSDDRSVMSWEIGF